MTTDPRLLRLINESEIRDVLIRERFHRDHGEWTAWRETYHPDASKTEVHTSLFHGTIDAFIALTRSTPNHFFSSFHTVSPSTILLSPCQTRALARALGTVNASFTYAGNRYDCIADVLMIVRLVFVEGGAGWRITKREAVYRRDRILRATPEELREEVGMDGRREEARNLDWLEERGGGKFDRGCLGFGEGEKVEEWVRRGREWVDSGVE